MIRVSGTVFLRRNSLCTVSAAMAGNEPFSPSYPAPDQMPLLSFTNVSWVPKQREITQKAQRITVTLGEYLRLQTLQHWPEICTGSESGEQLSGGQDILRHSTAPLWEGKDREKGLWGAQLTHLFLRKFASLLQDLRETGQCGEFPGPSTTTNKVFSPVGMNLCDLNYFSDKHHWLHPPAHVD